jgi:tRNA-2-methylthio-N6-dimethylallyladenosine synthase
MDGQIAEGEKSGRLQRLQAVINRHQKAFNAATLGRTLDVLLERPGRHAGQIVGKTPYMQAVQVMAPAAMIGEVVPVTITGLGTFSLFGTLAQNAAVPEPLDA